MSILLILVTLPRFDKQDKLGIKNYSYKEKLAKKDSIETFSDDIAYVDIVKKLRGDNSVEHAQVPYTYRHFSPQIAAKLPFKALTSLNLVNLTSLIFTLFVYIQILTHFKLSYKTIFITLLTYVVSFPVFYYSTTGLVDPTVQMWFAISLFFTLKEKLILAILSLIIGITAKESAILIIPIITLGFYYKLLNKNSLFTSLVKSLLFAVGLFGIYFITVYLCRKLSIDQNPSFMWKFDINNIIGNLVRPRAIISSGLSIGLTGILALFSIIKLKKAGYFSYNAIFKNSHQNLIFNKEINILFLGVISFLVFLTYAFFVIRVSGNYYLPLFTFTIPLAGIYLQNKLESSK